MADIKALSDRDLELTLRRASPFPMERLDDAVIQKPEVPVPGVKPIAIGTGPFAIVAQAGKEIEMRANDSFYDGRPLIDRVIIKPYESVRAAWAIRQLHMFPILDASSLSPEAGWGANEVIQIIPAELSTEDVMRIWDALDPAYRLSVSYIARLVRLDPDTQVVGRPVVASQFAYGEEARP